MTIAQLRKKLRGLPASDEGREAEASALPALVFTFDAVDTFERIVQGLTRKAGPRGTLGYCVRLRLTDGREFDAHLDALEDNADEDACLAFTEHREDDQRGERHVYRYDQISSMTVY